MGERLATGTRCKDAGYHAGIVVGHAVVLTSLPRHVGGHAMLLLSLPGHVMLSIVSLGHVLSGLFGTWPRHHCLGSRRDDVMEQQKASRVMVRRETGMCASDQKAREKRMKTCKM
jgi:hypothetical protein